jgi:hypothetical protein
VLPSQPSVWEHSCERHRAKSKHRAVEAPGASGNKAFACRTSCRTCETPRPGVRRVCSHNGVVKHREASGVASARNGGSGAGYAEAPAFRPWSLHIAKLPCGVLTEGLRGGGGRGCHAAASFQVTTIATVHFIGAPSDAARLGAGISRPSWVSKRQWAGRRDYTSMPSSAPFRGLVSGLRYWCRLTAWQ